MGLPIGVEQAVAALGGTELEKNGEYRLERGEARIYVIPRVIGKQTSVDLAVRIRPVPGGSKLAAPPQCELADAREFESRLGGASGDLRTETRRSTSGCSWTSRIATKKRPHAKFSAPPRFEPSCSIDGGLEVRAAIASALLYVLILLAGWLALRHKTRSRAPLLGLGVISLIAAPVTTRVLARVLNGIGDASVRAERVTVLEKGVLDKSRGRDIYWLEVSPWGKHTEGVQLDIDPQLHEALAKGDGLVLQVGEGRLGFEWISDIEVTRRR